MTRARASRSTLAAGPRSARHVGSRDHQRRRGGTRPVLGVGLARDSEADGADADAAARCDAGAAQKRRSSIIDEISAIGLGDDDDGDIPIKSPKDMNVSRAEGGAHRGRRAARRRHREVRALRCARRARAAVRVRARLIPRRADLPARRLEASIVTQATGAGRDVHTRLQRAGAEEARPRAHNFRPVGGKEPNST